MPPHRTLWLVLSWGLLFIGCQASGPPDAGDAGATDRDASAYPYDLESLDGLPLLRLSTDPAINREGYTPAEISLSGRRYVGTEAKYRGATSSSYPKKSFTLKFSKSDALDDAATGFTATRKAVLISSFDDNAYVRQALAFALWNRLDPEHVQVRTAFVGLVLDGEYHGLYLMADHIDGHLMEDLGMWEDGNLYKARDHSANFRTQQSDGKAKSPHTGFTKEEGLPEQAEAGAFADLDAFAEWLDQADETALTDNLAAYIDVRDYGDWWIIVSLIDALDSAGKNSYHYHDPRPADPANVFRCVPWDFNMSFGQNWKTDRAAPTRTLARYQTTNAVFERLLRSASFAPEIRARYRAALRDELSIEWVQAWLAQTRGQLEAAALHDEARWGEAYRSFFPRADLTDYAAETAYVDQWIRDRWAFVSAQLATP